MPSNVASTSRSEQYEAATIAWNGVSVASWRPSPVNAVLRAAGNLADRPSGRAAAAPFAPTASGGSTDPMFTALVGSSPVRSSQRPIHPVLTGAEGEAVCQMSMDRK